MGEAEDVQADPDQHDDCLGNQEERRPEEASEGLGFKGEPVATEDVGEMDMGQVKAIMISPRLCGGSSGGRTGCFGGFHKKGSSGVRYCLLLPIRYNRSIQPWGAVWILCLRVFPRFVMSMPAGPESTSVVTRCEWGLKYGSTAGTARVLGAGFTFRICVA